MRPLSLWLLGFTRLSKRRLAMVGDTLVCALTSYLAVYLRLGEIPEPTPALALLMATSVVLAIPIFWASGVYREIFSQSGVRTIRQIGRATVLYGFLFATIFTLISVAGVPRTVGLIQPILLFLSVSAVRALVRQWLGDLGHARRGAGRPQVLIYGAGSAGRHLAAAMAESREMNLVGFLDDDPALQGSTINGIPIFDPSGIKGIAERSQVSDVLLAMPSATQKRRNEILNAMRAASLRVRTLPGIMEVANGRVNMTDIRELDVQDLLGREPVAPDPDLLTRPILGKVVMVTGAGGSIGSELCRQILAGQPRRLVLLEVSEFALYTVHQELERQSLALDGGPVEIIPLLGSVGDDARVRAIIRAWRPDTIYHAAAYKHVPLVEHNPAEGVRNNVLGTCVVARAAADLGVADFVLISTDKAVRPTNVMGATKRAAELVLQALSAAGQGTTRFSMVRFGNVLGSSGSVVPLFRKQIDSGGPVTITDLRITRYFMTIPEAAQLVIQAGAMAEGGEVFVLDMGQPVKIADLARNMIEVSGRRIRNDDSPEGDIEIREIGLRPGEKLYEELLIGDNPVATRHPRILKANEHFVPLSELENSLDALSAAIKAHDPATLIHHLGRLVPEFTSECGVVDWIHGHVGGYAAETPPAEVAASAR